MKKIHCLSCGQITDVPVIHPGDTVSCENCREKLVSVPVGDTSGPLHQCAYCSTEVSESEITVFCPECGMEYHQECWEENEGCAAYGCPMEKNRSSAVNTMTPPPIPGSADPSSFLKIPMPSSSAAPIGPSGKMWTEYLEKGLTILFYTAAVLVSVGGAGILLFAAGVFLCCLGSLLTGSVMFLFLWDSEISDWLWFVSLLVSILYLIAGICLANRRGNAAGDIRKLWNYLTGSLTRFRHSNTSSAKKKKTPMN